MLQLCALAYDGSDEGRRRVRVENVAGLVARADRDPDEKQVADEVRAVLLARGQAFRSDYRDGDLTADFAVPAAWVRTLAARSDSIEDLAALAALAALVPPSVVETYPTPTKKRTVFRVDIPVVFEVQLRTRMPWPIPVVGKVL